MIVLAEVIRDPFVFDPDYIPPHLPFREGQMEVIAREVRAFAGGRPPTHIFLHGPPGTGKTVTAKKLLLEAQTVFPIKTAYVNAWNRRTRVGLLSDVATQVGLAVPIRGVSADVILEHLEHMDRMIVVVDEVDKLVGLEDVLYELSRLPNVLLITIANRRDFLSLLDPRILSTLFYTSIEFPAYTVPQLVEILRQRAERGLAPGSYSEEVLRACASVAYARGGDARIGIACLLNSAKRAEAAGRRVITLEDVRAVRDSLKTLPILEPRLAKIVELLQEHGPMTTKALFELYRSFYPVTDRTLRNYLRELVRLGIVEVVRAPVKGHVRVVRLKD